LLIFQLFFSKINLKQQLKKCFSHLKVSRIFGRHLVVLLLIVHLLLGFRRLREIDYYRDDPIVLRLMGLRKLPDVSTLSRALAQTDNHSVKKVRILSRSMVMQGLVREQLPRLTLDFDGSVQSTKGHAQGTAVGFNKAKKGALFESRMDSAFFNQNIISILDRHHVKFTASVPFERFVQLKDMVEQRKRWSKIDEQWSFFETQWKPKSWDSSYRFIFTRKRTKKQRKGPIQLHLFEPRHFQFDYKVIVTNKTESAKNVVLFHNGRGSQEAIFGNAKTDTALGVIPCRKLAANQTFTLCAMMAHNLFRQVQMLAKPSAPRTLAKRPAAWAFEKLDTLRHRMIQRAGRLVRPQGKLTLTMSSNQAVQNDLLHYLEVLQKTA
jgi:hypothetical protein